MSEDNPRQNISFASNGQTAYGYLAVPKSGSGPAIVVIQEWWGLTEHVVDVTDRLAHEGFVALAPDLYGGKTTHDAQEAAKFIHALPVEQAARDLSGAVDYLLEHEAVTSSSAGVVGFCMGGKFALVLAAQQGSRVGAVVPFYGMPPVEETDFSGIDAPIMGHYAEHDRSIPVEAVTSLQEAIENQSDMSPRIHLYPAGHAFFNDQNPANYHEESARLAWTRTLYFLRDNLS